MISKKFILIMLSFLVFSQAIAPAIGAQDLLDTPLITAQRIQEAAMLRDKALKDSDAYALVESLTMQVGPRFAGTEGDRAGVLWALSTLREHGFDNVHLDNVTVPRWERGSVDIAITAPWPQSLIGVALGGSVGTDEDGIEAPVIEVADIDALADIPAEQIAGKIVFFNKRMPATQDGQGYSDTVKARSRGPVLASRKGAVAVVIRSVGTSNARIGHTGSTKYKDDVPKIPALAISNADADMLAYQVAREVPVVLNIKMTSRTLSDTRSANVIGEITGGSKRNEIVLLGAHLDSWDLGTGAIDDGTGVAIVIEVAKLIREAGLKPDRTIRVVLFANEEFGLSGAKQYAEAHAKQFEKHIVGLESDLGSGLIWRFASRVAGDRRPIVEAMYPVLEPLGIILGDNESKTGADLSPMRKLGMPILGLNHDASEYFNYHHTRSDTLDKVNADNLKQAVAAFAAVTWLAATMDNTFGLLEPEEPEEEW